ncbi:MAG TPA: hypothetical protein VFO67_12290 [Gemmatimonadales bacterium]|nr:hypothetical protein [Gemmatimonadales bacterium]
MGASADIRWGVPILVAAMLAALSCATPRSGARPSSQRDLLRFDEIERTSAVNAYDAVRQLRPEWLRRRGRGSIQNATAEVLVVYLDGTRLGTPQTLRSIAAGSILEIRHLDASDATTRFGTGHAGGALLIRTK